jgi:hypothetical protein
MASHGWMSVDDVAPGDVLGDIVGGMFVRGVEVLAAGPESPGSSVWRITTVAGSFVLQGDATVYGFTK